MQIIMACGAMQFGPKTPLCKSLGGSETAALMLAKALGARGHQVAMFCNLPPPNEPDHVPSGALVDGVRFIALDQYATFVSVNECDLLIAVRDPNLVALPCQAKKKVLWAHDIFTKRGMKRALEQMSFTFDEIWAVSEWHKQQIIEATDYPECRVVALRNAIVQYDDLVELPRSKTQIVYASRPERGLENLVRPGGIMERLPEFKLVVAMYEHFPEHMRAYYLQLFQWMQRLPNVQYVGGQPNHALRQIIKESAAYIYPTQFEETSCILARECIEQGTPFVTTSIGALPETLGDSGIFFEDWLHESGIIEPDRGSEGWTFLFAEFFRNVMQNENELSRARAAMAARDDLYWSGVAEMVEENGQPQQVSHFSRVWSLMQDGDIIPAMAYFADVKSRWLHLSEPMKALGRELSENYAFIHGDIGKYYDDFYREKAETTRSELVFSTEILCDRHRAIADDLSKLPPGSRVFEYGCGAGHIIGPLAKLFPNIEFTGYDFSEAAVDCVNRGAEFHGLTNLKATADTSLAGFPLDTDAPREFDAVICSEVLEHVVKPWVLLSTVESYAKKGGRVIFTVPFGPWEPLSYEESEARWRERFHLWQIDQQMLKDMIGERPNPKIIMMVSGTSAHLRPIGNLFFSFDATHEQVNPIDPLEKAIRHRSRETCAAAVIAMDNEDTIVRMLNSIDKQVQFIQIALGPSTDNTRDLICEWTATHPWTRVKIIDAPKIEPRKFGFDDARNLSVEGIEDDFEWLLWIDTDEYLAGDFRKYLRPSALDGYLIAQHHFTVEPRGVPAEVDRPARLFRLDRGYRAYGHIHEHFELEDANGNGAGPGRCILLPDVDLGHVGYVNESVRQNRFFRNFPFLEWEHEENPDRKLHKFLWLRDIIHRMRFEQDPKRKEALAREAVEWYNANREDMGTFGPGLFMSLQYLGEANTLLGKGIPIRMNVKLDDRDATLQGVFESYEQVEAVLNQLLRDEFKERTSRYY